MEGAKKTISLLPTQNVIDPVIKAYLDMLNEHQAKLARLREELELVKRAVREKAIRDNDEKLRDHPAFRANDDGNQRSGGSDRPPDA